MESDCVAAMAESPQQSQWHNLALLSGGTDGEDGPTDAAGAFADEAVVTNMNEMQIDPNSYLQRHDSYHFFQAVHGLFKTGPTHTNVMDLRVGLAKIDSTMPTAKEFAMWNSARDEHGCLRSAWSVRIIL